MAQCYPRIVNPYMPQGQVNLTNAPTPLYAPGEVGCAFNDQNAGGSYLRVLVDSGATSSTPVGAVAAGQVAFWKNQSQGLVTNDQRMCDVGAAGAANRVAGIFQLAVTVAPGVNGSDGNPLQYATDLIIQKLGASVLCSTTPTAGALATANTSSTTANCISTAVGTAAPTQFVGTWTSATAVSGSLYPCNVNIGFID
jgi:hypothetical protein